MSEEGIFGDRHTTQVIEPEEFPKVRHGTGTETELLLQEERGPPCVSSITVICPQPRWHLLSVKTFPVTPLRRGNAGFWWKEARNAAQHLVWGTQLQRRGHIQGSKVQPLGG